MELSPAQIDQFIAEGYIKLEQAFPKKTAEEGRRILWQDCGCDPDDPSTWTQPVVRLGNYTQAPFQEAANSPLLHRSFDQLVGIGKWLPRQGLGGFPIRFPAKEAATDTGWHIDASFGTDDPDFLKWRINVFSKGRALLLLFLFSDVRETDAPTRIRTGSHLAIAKMLFPYGHEGLSLGELARNNFDETTNCPVINATGDAGTVYLCHPFLVHAAQAHHGLTPRFMAQPPLYPSGNFNISGSAYYSPVESAIRLAID